MPERKDGLHRGAKAGKGPTTFTIDWQPQPKQLALIQTPVRQIMYGGSAGGGKSAVLRIEALRWALSCPGINVFLFRRTLGELEDNHIRQLRQMVPEQVGRFNAGQYRYEFYNGSWINFCYCEKEADVNRYQGAEIHVLLVDEAAHLTEYQLSYLRTRVRLGDYAQKVPDQWRNWLPRVLFASNPGGPGHNFLRRVFIDASPPLRVFRDSTTADPTSAEGTPEAKGWQSVFIPARMADNKYLDRGYAGQFSNLPPELARALTEGDWDAVVGQALHTLQRDMHQLRDFRPPAHWTHFMAMDWGTARPFSIGWYCVSEGAILEAKDGWKERYLPPGSIVRYAEWYGSTGKANEGLRLESPEVARRVLAMERERGDPPMEFRVADAACWNKHDGPSVAERFQDVDARLALRKSEKDRKAAYTEFLDRLAPDPEHGQPMFFATVGCKSFWRTIPPLVLDDLDPDKGPGTKQEDHPYDEVCYALLSRPITRTEETHKADVRESEMRAAGIRNRGKPESRYATGTRMRRRA